MGSRADLYQKGKKEEREQERKATLEMIHLVSQLSLRHTSKEVHVRNARIRRALSVDFCEVRRAKNR